MVNLFIANQLQIPYTMKKVYAFFLSAIISSTLIFTVVGCKLDKPIFPDGADSLKTNGSTKPPTINTADSYQPTTKGTYWKYTAKITDPFTKPPVDTTELRSTTMDGTTITINNKLYYKATSTVNSMTGYTYFYYGNNTYSYRSNTINPGSVIEYVYLKDNVDIGITWTAPITDDGKLGGTPAQITGQIMEKNITRTISGKTFTNVTHTQLLLQYDTGAGFTTYQTMDYYIAKGVGIIQISTANKESSTTKSDAPITDYSIK